MKQELLTTEFKQTEIGDIPTDWDIDVLGKYCKVFSGFAFKSADLGNQGTMVVKIGNLQNGTIVEDKRTQYFPVEKLLPKHNKYYLEMNDLLIAMTGATTGKISRVPNEYSGTLLNQRVGKFAIDKQKINPLFFKYITESNSFQEKIQFNIRKSAQGNISPKQIEQIIIPIPLETEQEKIASVLSSIQDAKEKTEKLISSLKELKKSMMQHLFTYGPVNIQETESVKLKQTEIGEIPEDWEIKQIKDLFDIKQGKQINSKESKKEKTIRPFLRTSNLNWGNIILDKVDEMPFTDKEFETLKLVPNDILLCEGGDIGRTALFRGEVNDCAYQNHLHRLRPKTNNILPLYFVYWMNIAITQRNLYIFNANRTTIPNLSGSRLGVFEIPYCPIEKQQAIVDNLQIVDEKISSTIIKLNAQIELFNSMLHNLMTGKIRVKDLEV